MWKKLQRLAMLLRDGGSHGIYRICRAYGDPRVDVYLSTSKPRKLHFQKGKEETVVAGGRRMKAQSEDGTAASRIKEVLSLCLGSPKAGSVPCVLAQIH